MTRLRHIRLWLAGLLCLCSLLCAAESASNRREDQRDARKLRYEFKQQQTKDKGAPATEDEAGASSKPEKAKQPEPAAKDSEQPLSLLPDGAKPDALANSSPADTPNQLPGMDNLAGGATVSRRIESPAKPAGSGTIAAVRSMTRDGGGFGEERIVNAPAAPAVKPAAPSVMAQSSPPKGQPSLRSGDTAKPAASRPPQMAKSEPAAVKPQTKPTLPPVTARPPAKPAVMAIKPSKAAGGPKPANAQLPGKPLTTNLPDKREALTGGLPNQIAQKPVATEPEASKQAAEPDFKWLNDDFYKQHAAGTTPVDELKTQAPAGVPELGIPQSVPSTRVADLSWYSGKRLGRLASWLLGGAVLIGIGLLAISLPKPRRQRHASDDLAVIETIGLGDGRQLVIVQKRYYALVLGVTRQATHLLEKVAMSALDGNYRQTIQRIIERESEAPAGQWRMRPIFSSLYENSMPAFSDLSGELRQTNIGELRQHLQVVGARIGVQRPAAVAHAPQLSRQQVKDRLRRRASETYSKAS